MEAKIKFTFTLDEDAIVRYCEARRMDDEEIKRLLNDESALQEEFEGADLSDFDDLGRMQVDVEVR